jgi:predicted enzyme related to lactoylglutathione lyase
MEVKAIAFVMYPVTDMERAVRFYTDVVGLKKSGLEIPYWVEFDIAGTTFGIGNFEQVGTPGTAAALALEVVDMTLARETLAKHGVETSEPFETPVCFISGFADPDGNRISLHQSKAA